MSTSVVKQQKNQKLCQLPADEASLLVDLPFLPGGPRWLRYSPTTRVLIAHHTVVRLTPSENILFQILVERPGQVVTTQRLQRTNQHSLQMVRQHLGTLRQKLWLCELDVECVYSKGYRLASYGVGEGQTEEG